MCEINNESRPQVIMVSNRMKSERRNICRDANVILLVSLTDFCKEKKV
jgi:hypothetical protein